MFELKATNENIENDYLKENKMKEVKTMIINVNGMSCNNCAKHVKNALDNIEGVNEAVVSLDDKNAEISYEGNIDEKVIEEAITEAGYEYKGIESK